MHDPVDPVGMFSEVEGVKLAGEQDERDETAVYQYITYAEDSLVLDAGWSNRISPKRPESGLRMRYGLVRRVDKRLLHRVGQLDIEYKVAILSLARNRA